MSEHAAGVAFILDRFVSDTDKVRYAQTISADGMHLAASGGLDRVQLDTFAAIASGLASLTDSAVRNFDLGVVTRQIIESSNGWILVSRISDTAAMGVVAAPDADLGLVGYEMAVLSRQLGEILSPEVIDQLKNTLVVSE